MNNILKHPCLLRQPWDNLHAQLTRRMLLPLPEGEGWGEGERDGRLLRTVVYLANLPVFTRGFRRCVRSPLWYRLLLCTLPFLLLGCDKLRPRVQDEPPPSPRFSLETYPRMNRMRLATLPCRVLPRTSISVNSPFAGQLRLYVDKPQTNLPAGFVWAEFEPKLLIAESNALADAKSRLNERERLTMELDLPKQTLKLARDMEEAKRQLTLLEVMATNKALLGSGISFPGLKDHSLNPDNLDRARSELKWDPLESTCRHASLSIL